MASKKQLKEEIKRLLVENSSLRTEVDLLTYCLKRIEKEGYTPKEKRDFITLQS